MPRDRRGGWAVAALVAVAMAGCSSPERSAAPQAPLPTPQPTPRPTPSVGALLPSWESIEAAEGAGVTEYRIASGDVVDIMVFGHEDMRKELPVRPDGSISYILVGDVPAVGRTVAELRQDLEERLRRHLRYPKVDVILKKAQDASFMILGEVVRPGVYPIQGRTTLLDAVALAQGLASGQYEGSTIETADLRNAFLVRRQKVVPIDFELAIHRGDTRQNVAMEDGDYIYIPSALAQEVYVLGEVSKPRAYGFRGRVTLLQAVAESGGFTSEARLADVVILRGAQGSKQLIPVNVREILSGRAADPELAVGDVVYAPRRRLASLGDVMEDILSTLLVYEISTGP